VELARWLVAFVAFVTAIGGLLADYFIPSSGAQHIKNPRWPLHAKFHNAQSILMGLILGALAIAILFQRSPVSKIRLLLSALLASIYWLCIFAAPSFQEQPSATPSSLQRILLPWVYPPNFSSASF
jgi:hypothetical protein